MPRRSHESPIHRLCSRHSPSSGRASARSGSCYGGDGKYVSNKIQVCRSVPCATEADIFAFLGIDYKSPEERAVADNATAVGSRARAIRLGAGLAADSDDDDGAA